MAMNITIPGWAQTLAAAPLTPWLLGSVLVYAAATHVAWWLRERDRFSAPPGSWLREVLRFTFYLGIPYLALGGWPRPPLSGLLSLPDLGLVGPGPPWPAHRWLGAVSLAFGIGLAAFLLLGLAWIQAKRNPGSAGLGYPSHPWWALLVDVVYLQVHWAFYRGGLEVILDDPYGSAFLGLALVYGEWALDPFWRRSWRQPGRAGEPWLRSALALVSSVLYLMTRNLWVCLALHATLEPGLRWLGRQKNPLLREETPAG
jgi:hypothetical protein